MEIASSVASRVPSLTECQHVLYACFDRCLLWCTRKKLVGAIALYRGRYFRFLFRDREWGVVGPVRNPFITPSPDCVGKGEGAVEGVGGGVGEGDGRGGEVVGDREGDCKGDRVGGREGGGDKFVNSCKFDETSKVPTLECRIFVGVCVQDVLEICLMSLF